MSDEELETQWCDACLERHVVHRDWIKPLAVVVCPHAPKGAPQWTPVPDA